MEEDRFEEIGVSSSPRQQQSPINSPKRTLRNTGHNYELLDDEEPNTPVTTYVYFCTVTIAIGGFLFG